MESLLVIEYKNRITLTYFDTINSYTLLRKVIGIKSIKFEDWQRIVLSKPSYEKLPSIQHTNHITLPLFRQVLYAWMEICGIPFPPRVLHIMITRLFCYLKNNEGYVDVRIE